MSDATTIDRLSHMTPGRMTAALNLLNLVRQGIVGAVEDGTNDANTARDLESAGLVSITTRWRDDPSDPFGTVAVLDVEACQ